MDKYMKHTIEVVVEFTEPVRADDAAQAIKEILVAGNNTLGPGVVRRSMGVRSAWVDGSLVL